MRKSLIVLSNSVSHGFISLLLLQLPNLRLRRLQTDYSQVITVLRCQRWLQELDLHCIAKDILLLAICVHGRTTLKRLSLQYCSQVTLVGMIAIPWMENLTSLKLFQCCKVRTTRNSPSPGGL